MKCELPIEVVSEHEVSRFHRSVKRSWSVRLA